MKEPVYDLIPILAVNEGQIMRIKITKKNICYLENRGSCNEILAIFADCPFRSNRILSADERAAFPYAARVHPMARQVT